ncbi:MAG: hypothetical protein J6P29_01295 [Acetobacter sp.]|nr:hypothetical protein [Acetobacter sp.]
MAFYGYTQKIYSEEAFFKREEELKFFFNWVHRKSSEGALRGLKVLIEALRKDLRRLKGDLEEGEQEEEIVEIETKEEDSGAAENVAENSALEVYQPK